MTLSDYDVEILIVPAVRYALNSHTYIVSSVSEAVMNLFPKASVKTLSVLARDIREHIEEEEKEETSEMYNMDLRAWREFEEKLIGELKIRGYKRNEDNGMFEKF